MHKQKRLTFALAALYTARFAPPRRPNAKGQGRERGQTAHPRARGREAKDDCARRAVCTNLSQKLNFHIRVIIAHSRRRRIAILLHVHHVPAESLNFLGPLYHVNPRVLARRRDTLDGVHAHSSVAGLDTDCANRETR